MSRAHRFIRFSLACIIIISIPEFPYFLPTSFYHDNWIKSTDFSEHKQRKKKNIWAKNCFNQIPRMDNFSTKEKTKPHGCQLILVNILFKSIYRKRQILPFNRKDNFIYMIDLLLTLFWQQHLSTEIRTCCVKIICLSFGFECTLRLRFFHLYLYSAYKSATSPSQFSRYTVVTILTINLLVILNTNWIFNA